MLRFFWLKLKFYSTVTSKVTWISDVPYPDTASVTVPLFGFLPSCTTLIVKTPVPPAPAVTSVSKPSGLEFASTSVLVNCKPATSVM